MQNENEVVTNAQRVREQIQLHIAAGDTYEQCKATIVTYCVTVLKQKRALARRYVKENWVRVLKYNAAAKQVSA